MEKKPYYAKMADADENIVSITVPVTAAAADPVFTHFTSLTPRARFYKQERDTALAEVKELINIGFQSAHSSPLTKERSYWKADEFGLTTLKVLTAEYSDGDGPQRLVEFLYHGDPDNFRQFRSWYPIRNREITMRELAVFSRQLLHIDEKMVFLMLESLRVSHPTFALEDLTELRGHEAQAFMTALSFTAAVYESQSCKEWKHQEGKDWEYIDLMEEAQRRCPRFNSEFIDLLIERPERHSDIMRYLWLNNVELLTVDRIKVETYLDSPAGASSTMIPTLSSIATDARLLLGSYVRAGRSKIGI